MELRNWQIFKLSIIDNMNYLFFDQSYPTPEDIQTYLHWYSHSEALEPWDWVKKADIIINYTKSLMALLAHSEFLYFLWRFSVNHPSYIKNNSCIWLAAQEDYAEIITWLLWSDQAFRNSVPIIADKIKIRRIARSIIWIQYRFLKITTERIPNHPRIQQLIDQENRYVNSPFFNTIGRLD